MKFSKEFLLDVAFDCSDDATVILEETLEIRRWSVYYRKVFSLLFVVFCIY